jgi:serine/threonine protein kinase
MIDDIPHEFTAKTNDFIDTYKVISHIGEGGFADVYKVYLPNDLEKTFYALKLLRLWKVKDKKDRDEIRKRFEREYETGKIESDYLIKTYSSGEIKGNPYCVMDFHSKGDLREELCRHIKDGSNISLEKINRYAHDILFGLKNLHDKNKIHRDLKPENILFNTLSKKSELVLTDFGIAGDKFIRITYLGHLFRKPKIPGTIEYAPPEQIKTVDKNSIIKETMDIFSFGVIMFELFTKELPFGRIEGKSDISDYIRRMNEGRYFRISDYRGDVPDIWQKVIYKCIDPDYNKRFQNVDEINSTLGFNNTSHCVPDPNTIKYKLKIVSGADSGKIFMLEQLLKDVDHGIITIGRKHDKSKSKIQINDPCISLKHATIEKIPKNSNLWYVKDGQFVPDNREWKYSKNGTMVNTYQVKEGERILLKHNDTITIGETEIKFFEVRHLT